MNKLGNYITGRWITGDGDGQVLYDAVTGDDIAISSTEGLDFASILDYGRKIGNPALRKMTFHERGRMLRALAVYLNERKEKFYQVSYKTGATKADSWIDIEGGIGNLFCNASLRRKFPDEPYCTDGDGNIEQEQILSWGIISWFPKKEWPFISMHLIFLYGECLKNSP